MTDEPTIRGGIEPAYQWDFFLAHAGDDLDVARNLKQKLDPPARAFLDDANVRLGDDWDETLSEAQRSALISVIIVSPNTTKAHYEREEIATAIQMARQDPDTHRVIPVFVGARQLAPAQIPYGLRLKHGLSVAGPGDFPMACERLLETLRMMKHYEEKKAEVVTEYRQAIPRITGDDKSASLLGALGAVTQFARPFLLTLCALFVLVAALLIVCLSLPYFADVRPLIVTFSGALLTLIVGGVILVLSQSFKMAGQIGQGRINGG